MVVSLFLFVLALLPNLCMAYTATDADTLRNDMFANYSSKNRPQNKTDIKLVFGLFHITEFDIISQQLHCMGFLIAFWTDDRLQWNAANYGNMQEFFVFLSDVWAPPLVLSNSADEILIINDIGELASTNVYLTPDGNITWMAPATIKAQCSVDIMYYPFDSQDCIIVISSWLFLKTHVNLRIASPSIFFDLYEVNGEWDIASSSAEEQTRTLAGYELSSVHFNLRLKRKYSYYLVNMLLPVVILAILGPFVFMLPVESGEKIGFTLTILLSLSVVMSQVSDSIPPTSTHVCLLSLYLLLTFIICSVETLLTVVVCTLHDYHNRGFHMGKRWQKIARFLAKVTIYRKPVETDGGDEPDEGAGEEMKKPKKLSREELKDKAWEGNMETDNEINYSYGDVTDLLDRFSLYAFSFLSGVITFVFVIATAAGGAA